jgi:hypothetical protein
MNLVLKLSIFLNPWLASKMTGCTSISSHFFMDWCLINHERSQINNNEKQKVATDLEIDATLMR